MPVRQYFSEVDGQISKPHVGTFEKAVFVLHDQLNLSVWPQWLRDEKPLLIFIESVAKGQSLPYHKKKLTYVLSSMRHFALECHDRGYPIYYHATEKHYDDGLKELLNQNESLELTFMTPSEWTVESGCGLLASYSAADGAQQFQQFNENRSARTQSVVLVCLCGCL